MNQDNIEVKREKEKQTLRIMIGIYCRNNHGTGGDKLCSECHELAEYAQARTERCPHMETKTFCSKCKTRCYKPEMREKIRKVMRYSGPRMMFCSPVLFIKHKIVEVRSK